MAYVHCCLIVPLAQQATAQGLCAGLAGPPGAGMFITGLSANGATPASHYITAGMIEDQFAALLTDANATYAACQAAGLTYTLAQIQALLAAADLSTDDPFAAMARLGLQLVQVPL